MSSKIFVFGSNLAGRHGKGAALFAKTHRGAIYGQGQGRQGNSYAIPTKDDQLRPLNLYEIKYWVDKFLDYAEMHKDLEFELTPIGCGLAGFHPEQIAPFFKHATRNVQIPKEFQGVIGGS